MAGGALRRAGAGGRGAHPHPVHLLGERQHHGPDTEQYESGIKPAGPLPRRLSVEFYQVALFFVIFDLEAVFIFSWAVAARRLGWPGYLELARLRPPALRRPRVSLDGRRRSTGAPRGGAAGGARRAQRRSPPRRRRRRRSRGRDGAGAGDPPEARGEAAPRTRPLAHRRRRSAGCSTSRARLSIPPTPRSSHPASSDWSPGGARTRSGRSASASPAASSRWRPASRPATTSPASAPRCCASRRARPTS